MIPRCYESCACFKMSGMKKPEQNILKKTQDRDTFRDPSCIQTVDQARPRRWTRLVPRSCVM